VEQIATVNKLRQKLQNSLRENLQLGVPYLRLAINDALGYEAEVHAQSLVSLTLGRQFLLTCRWLVQNDDGGLDGSVLFELDQPQNADLGQAAKAVLQIKRELQATNEVCGQLARCCKNNHCSQG